MNIDKRQLFRDLKLRILLSELLPLLSTRLPSDELTYELEFTDPNRSGVGGSRNRDNHVLSPPLLPSEFVDHAKEMSDRYQVTISEDLVTVHTRKVVKEGEAIVAQEFTHSFSVLDIVDP
jgi:hypothetical protein